MERTKLPSCVTVNAARLDDHDHVMFARGRPCVLRQDLSTISENTSRSGLSDINTTAQLEYFISDKARTASHFK
jgi:hypothetical protein